MLYTDDIQEGLEHAEEYGLSTVPEAFGIAVAQHGRMGCVITADELGVDANDPRARAAGMAYALDFLKEIHADPRTEHLRGDRSFEDRHRHRQLFVDTVEAFSGYDLLAGKPLSNHEALTCAANLKIETNEDRSVFASAQDFMKTGQSKMADQFEFALQKMAKTYVAIYETDQYKRNELEWAEEMDRKKLSGFTDLKPQPSLKPKVQKIKRKSKERVR